MGSDAELIESYRSRGDRDALDTLFRRHVHRVYRLTLRVLKNEAAAEDATQSAFVAALQGLGALRDRERFAPWLCGIAFRIAQKSHRSARLESRGRVAAGQIAAQAGSESSMANPDLERALKAVNDLPEDYRLPILLHHCDGLSYEEIAAALEMPQGTVGTNIHRGLDQIRVSLSGIASAAALAVLLESVTPASASAEALESISRLARSAPLASQGTAGPDALSPKAKVSLGIVLGAGLLFLVALGLRPSEESARQADGASAAARIPSSPRETVSPAPAGQVAVLDPLSREVAEPRLPEDQVVRNERAAIRALREIATGEADFRANDRDQNEINDFWTGDMSGLYRLQGDGPGGQLKLIQESLAAADAFPAPAGSGMGPGLEWKPFQGYWFRMLPLASTRQGRSLKEFAVTAWPASYGVTGRRTFLFSEFGLVLAKDLKGFAAESWPSDDDLGTWEHDPLREPVQETPLDSFPKEVVEIGRATAGRHGFGVHDLEARRFYDPKKHVLLSFPEYLEMDAARWTEFQSFHDRLLERARVLEKDRAHVQSEGAKTVIEIGPFPQEGLALVTEWRRYLEATLTPDQLRKYDPHRFMVFPEGLGQHAVMIKLERIGEHIVGRERVTLPNGREVFGPFLGETEGLPRSCRHLVK